MLVYVLAAAAEPVTSFDKVQARLAFRRRSVSENTYDRCFQLHHNVDEDAAGLASAAETLAADPSKRAVGVVCSNEDLKAIVHQHKRRQSPTEIAIAAVSPGADDTADRTLPFMHATAPNDRVGASAMEPGSELAAARGPMTPSTVAMSSVEALSSESSGAAAGASLPASAGIVVAGFTPTVASITEQNSLEILESTPDSVAETPPPLGVAERPTSVAETSPPNSSVCTLPTVAEGSPTVTQERGRSVESLFNSVAETPPPSAAAKPRSTVPDVVYDEHGQTWDVYGAEFDPLILGQAIQSYLEKIMARKIQSAARNDRRRRPSSEKLTVDDTGSKDDQSRGGRPEASGRDGSSTRDRALSFVMRYLCSSVWRPGRTSR